MKLALFGLSIAVIAIAGASFLILVCALFSGALRKKVRQLLPRKRWIAFAAFMVIILPPALYCLFGCKSEIIDISSGRVGLHYDILDIPFYWTTWDSPISRVLQGERPLGKHPDWHTGDYWPQPWLQHHSPSTKWGPAVSQLGRLERQWLAYDLSREAQKKMASNVLCSWQCNDSPLTGSSSAGTYLNWVDNHVPLADDSGQELSRLILSTQVCELRQSEGRTECVVHMPQEESVLSISIQQAGAGLDVAVRNTSSKPVMLVDRFDPAHEVVELEITDTRGQKCGLKRAADWVILMDDPEHSKDVISLRRGEVLKRTISFDDYELPPGEYTVRAAYRLRPTDSFVDTWTTRGGRDIVINSDRDRQWVNQSVAIARALWFGEARSNEIKVTVNEGK